MFLAKLHKNLFRRLFPDKTPTDFPGGYIPNKFFSERVKGAPILVVGDYNGRDYSPLKEKYSGVYLLDVVDNNIAPKELFVKQSITERTPFKDKFFKHVILINVIEHVWEDKRTLEEIRRILKDDGELFMNFPFYNDGVDHHYHIYSPRTGRILLRHSGFDVKEWRYYDLKVAVLRNEVIALCAIFLYPFFGKKALEKVNNLIYKTYLLISKPKKLNTRFGTNRWSRNLFGAFVVAKKSAKIIDPIKVQQESFGAEYRSDL